MASRTRASGAPTLRTTAADAVAAETAAAMVAVVEDVAAVAVEPIWQPRWRTPWTPEPQQAGDLWPDPRNLAITHLSPIPSETGTKPGTDPRGLIERGSPGPSPRGLGSRAELLRSPLPKILLVSPILFVLCSSYPLIRLVLFIQISFPRVRPCRIHSRCRIHSPHPLRQPRNRRRPA